MQILRSFLRALRKLVSLSSCVVSHVPVRPKVCKVEHIAVIGAAGLILFAPRLETRGFSSSSVGVISSLERVRRIDSPDRNRSPALSAARGEYEAFQIIMSAPVDGLHDVKIAATDLIGPRDQIIAKHHFTFYREHYVSVVQPSPDSGGRNQSLGAGWYPDGLIPLDTGRDTKRAPFHPAFNVSPGTNQPVWVDLFIPRDAIPGVYRGAVRVISREGTVEVPISLNVWNFELPRKPTLKSNFGYWAPTREGVELLLAHKVMPGRLRNIPCLEGSCGELLRTERDLMEGFGLSMTDVGFWSGADFGNCKMLPAPSVAQFRSAAAAHTKDLHLFNYTADEIKRCPHLYPSLKNWARNMHLAGIKNLVVIEPVAELLDDGSGSGRSAVDIWVVLPKHYRESENWIGRALAKGDEIWSYNTLVQDSDSPKWLIDYEPINFRIQPGFLSQSLHFTGVLYWRVDRWSPSRWDEVNNVGVFEVGANYPGEGMLIYPGDEVGIPGVIPSIRLKQIREGIEDYEYVEILKRLGRSAWALELAKKVAPDWTRWSRDRGELDRVRRQLGEEIDRLESERARESE